MSDNHTEKYLSKTVAMQRYKALQDSYDYLVLIKSRNEYWIHTKPQDEIRPFERIVREFERSQSYNQHITHNRKVRDLCWNTRKGANNEHKNIA